MPALENRRRCLVVEYVVGGSQERERIEVFKFEMDRRSGRSEGRNYH